MTSNDAVRRTAVAVLALALVVVGASGGAAAHGGDDGFHHHDGWMGTHGGLGGLGVLWMLVWILVLVAVPAVAYVYLTGDRAGDGTGGDEALSQLRSRYARGEIDEDEFERRRDRLTRTDRVE